MASKFKIQTQEKLNWCWAAVASSLAHYVHSDKPQCNIAGEVLGQPPDRCCRTPDACNKQADLKTALEKIGGVRVDQLQRPIGFGLVKNEIDSGRPVCARIQWFGEKRAHFVMISGYSSSSGQKWLDISDPYYEDSTVLYDHFIRAYLDAGRWTDTFLVSRI